MPLEPAIYVSDLQDAFLLLLTLTPVTTRTLHRLPSVKAGHPWLIYARDPGDGLPLYVVNNPEPIVSRGRTFEPYPFALTLPPDTGDKVRELRIVIDNVDRALIELVRGYQSPPLVKVELILASTPNVSERTIDFLRLDSVDYDASQITLSLQPAHMFARQFPRSTFSPVEWPGMFL